MKLIIFLFFSLLFSLKTTAQDKPDLSNAVPMKDLSYDEFARSFALSESPPCYQPVIAFDRYRNRETKISVAYQRCDGDKWIMCEELTDTREDFYFFIHGSGLYVAVFEDEGCTTMVMLRVERMVMREVVWTCER